MSVEARMPCLFIPHGGGPCFFMDAPPPFSHSAWDKMAGYLRGVGPSLAARPKAILVVSGHWDAKRPTVNTAAQHSLYYDYYGFPEHTYRLTYPAKGSPELAAHVRDLLARAGVESDEEPRRGLDHGVFIPFMLMFPDADIPIVQLSLREDMDASAHLAIGRALEPLRDEGVLIVGSGMSYHNLREFFRPGRGDADSRAFDSWLVDAVSDPARRDARLKDWLDAPSAAACHPEPEHLLPLHVVAGAAGADVGRRVYEDQILGKAVSAFQFG
ncbi:MAG: class III extradiol ring-cleavage dioxygenase [Roseiarcus sp.]|jgi:aromatic ring-opening dioxygenase catalytic subunit (LigB family)